MGRMNWLITFFELNINFAMNLIYIYQYLAKINSYAAPHCAVSGQPPTISSFLDLYILLSTLFSDTFTL
jgi:hypothetical protein